MAKKGFYFARVLFALITIVLIAAFVGVQTVKVAAQGSENVIYLSDEGSDTNDGRSLFTPVRTLSKACSLAGKDGKVVICDVYTHKTGDAITCARLEGFNHDCVFEVAAWKVDLGSDCVIDNLTIRTSHNWAFLLCNGNRLEVGENVKSVRAGNATVHLSIRGGGEGTYEKSTSIVLKGGEWGSVYGGTRNGNIMGSTHVTVYEGANITSAVSAGNDASTTSSMIYGPAVLKLVGKEMHINEYYGEGSALGGLYLDITEYSGKANPAWNSAGYTVVGTKAGLPDMNNIIKPAPTAPSTGTKTTVVPGKGVFYISDNGDDEKDGKTSDKAFKTLEKALASGGINPTVVVVDTYTKGTSTALSPCRIVGQTSDSKLVINTWALALGGDVTIENVKLVTNVQYSYILARGYMLTIEKGVSVEKGNGINTGLGIRGGSEEDIGGNTSVIIKSGNWTDVHGGTRNGSVTGSTMLIVHEGVHIGSVNVGNNGSKEGNKIAGDGYLKLVGNPKIDKILGKPDILNGNMYLDLSEFTGTRTDEMNNLKAEIITSKEEVPNFVTEHFKAREPKGDYDLSGVKNPRFLSDDGDDANDGLTIDTPKKTFKALKETFVGCDRVTVVIVGTYTLNESFTSEVPYDLTSSSGTDSFIFKYWLIDTNSTTIYNINLIVARDYNCIFHSGKPLTIGENVEIGFTSGASVVPLIRANGSGDYPLTDITIRSGRWIIYAGTASGNILGNARITVTGGTASISVGNDSAGGRIMGSTVITLKGKPVVSGIGDRGQSDGFIAVDVCDFEGVLPEIPESIMLIEKEEDRVLPIQKNAVYISGYPDGTFLPEKVMTRAEAATVVAKISGMPSGFAFDGSGFSDVSKGDWYAPYVAWLEAFGALDFLGDKFSASEGITRGEFVKLISRIPTESKGGEAPSFTDVADDHPYKKAILDSASRGLVTGYPDGTFKPDNTLKRSEIVTVLGRLSERNVVSSHTEGLSKFSDIDGHWARAAILSASVSPITDGRLIWYTGKVLGSNTTVDKSTLSFPVTSAVLEGVDKTDATAVMASIEKYAEKRRGEIRGTKTDIKATGISYYVSENGDDKNDGTSPEKPWKTLDMVNSASLYDGDAVFFERGGVFRGQLRTKRGVTYSAYGENDGDAIKEKPQILGSLRNYAESPFWDKTEQENVYISREAFDKDVGLIVFDEGKEVSIKKIIGVGGFEGTLSADLEMYHSTADKRLYLYSETDPNTRWKSVEIARGEYGIGGDGNYVTIDNICLKYAGAHGIGYGDGTTGLTVQNCEIGWIGGMIQYDNVRYGNGIEIYIGCRDYTIENCLVYQCYDAGITHQYFQTRDEYVAMEGIRYANNVIEYCTYDIEYVNAQPEDKGIMKDIVFTGNLLIHGGEGWGAQRPGRGDTVVKSYGSVNHGENILYYDNVIATSEPKSMLFSHGVENLAWMPELIGNVFAAKKGTNFGFYGMKASTEYIYDETLTDLTVGLEDNTMIFID